MDLIAISTDCPSVNRPPSEDLPELIAAMSAERASQGIVMRGDGAGGERGVEFTRGTSIIGRKSVQARTLSAERLLAEFALECGRSSIPTPNDALADKRPGRSEGPQW